MRYQYFAIVTACLLLCGCGKAMETSVSESIIDSDSDEILTTAPATAPEVPSEIVLETIQETIPETEIQSEISSTESRFLPWQIAYRDLILEQFSDSQNTDFRYSLIYVDNDDIPELLINTQVEASGEIIYTYYDNHLAEQQLSRIGTVYIPENGLLYNNCGHMGYYPSTVYELKNGVFSAIASGVYQDAYAEDGNRILNENGEPVYEYYWNDEKVSERDFHENLNSVFDTASGIRPAEEHTIEEILVQITSDYR